MASSRADTARAAVDLTFEELYRGLRADVYRAALRQLGNAHDAEDVTQAAFADAYRAVLRGARPESPRAWLLAISENVRRRRFRTAQRRPREELVDDADFPLAAELPFEQSRELTDALATLPEEQGRVFVLREIVGLSYGEIAEELGSTVGSVQMLLFRARRSLRDALDPPTVAARRPLFLPPLPGWLVGLWSRAELATLTPRTAGALAGAVLTVGGASVAVPVSQADGLRPAPAAAPSIAPAPSVAPAGRPGSLGVVAKRAPRRSTPLDVSATSVRTTRSPRPAALAQASVASPAAVVPVAAPAAGATQAAVAEREQTDLAPTSPGLVATAAAGVAEQPVALPVPPVLVPVPLPESPPLPLPSAVPETLPTLPEVVETATGAAGAAGASAPPVPVPLPPLPGPPLLP